MVKKHNKAVKIAQNLQKETNRRRQCTAFSLTKNIKNLVDLQNFI